MSYNKYSVLYQKLLLSNKIKMLCKPSGIPVQYRAMSTKLNSSFNLKNYINIQYNLQFNFRSFCTLCYKNNDRRQSNWTLSKEEDSIIKMPRRKVIFESKLAERLRRIRPQMTSNAIDLIRKQIGIESVENKITNDLIDLHPRIIKYPMRQLQLCYTIIANAFDDKNLYLNPTWHMLKNHNITSWCCKFTVNWPDWNEFSAAANTKQSAADKAALNFLQYLRNNNKISYEGFPIFISNNNNSNIATKHVQLQSIQRRNYTTNVVSRVQRAVNKGPEHILIEKEAENLSKLYPSPKNTLHNFYDNVARELQDDTLRISPVYNSVKEKDKKITSWCCTYEVKWPSNEKFVKVGRSKQEASHKAALSILAFLQLHEKITKDGQPIIQLTKRQQKDISKPVLQDLDIDIYSLERMREIIDIYKNDFASFIGNKLDDIENNNNNNFNDYLDDYIETKDVRFKSDPKFLGTNRYLAKEKVRLPVAAYKQKFMSLLDENRVIIVTGEPGCGKSTRIPQYVLESWALQSRGKGNCRIAVTQPRRIAAISLAERVSHERDETTGSLVGYQVRLKSLFQPSTGRILFCTTGILLRHLQSDPTLSNFSHIILDEAHERDINTDLLMNLLKGVMKVNQTLKVIVMSATIDSDMICDYFENAPVMHIPGFTYPVVEHFVDEISRCLPINKIKKMCDNPQPSIVHDEVVSIINYIHRSRPEGAILCFLPGWDDISKIQKMIPVSNDTVVYCLHSRLQDSEQWKIFSRPPPGVRKIILATNIAETSVTIDDVVFVIDTGIHKEHRFDNEKGVLCLDNHWIAKSNMLQRKGRAGRCQAGESFHLYTKQKYDSFEDFAQPEIMRSSLTKVVLDSKIYSDNMNTMDFMCQLPCPPEEGAVIRAVNELRELELLDEKENLTPLGKILVDFQLEPKLAKTLVNSVIYKCVTPIVDIVTLYAAEIELFTTGLINKEQIKRTKEQFCPNSDHLALMRIFEKWLQLLEDEGEEAAERFCNTTNLISHKLITVDKLRNIHFDYLRNGLYESLAISDDYSDNDELVKGVLFSGTGTLLQNRHWDKHKGRLRKANVFVTNKNHRATITSDSVNYNNKNVPSCYFIYINETRSNLRRTTLIRECSVISPLTILLMSNKELTVEEKPNDIFLLGLKDSKIEFVCPKSQALVIIKCKEVLNEAYDYYIYQMTEGKGFDEKANKSWTEILSKLNSILSKHDTSPE